MKVYVGNGILGTLKSHSTADRMGFNNKFFSVLTSASQPSLGGETFQARCPGTASPATDPRDSGSKDMKIWLDGWMDG